MTRSICCVMALGLAGAAWAQSTYGTFVGTIRDPSGAVVASATIQLTNKGTSAQRSATTDSSGSYNLVNVEPGDYEIAVQAPGFQRSVFSGLTLTARQTIRVDGTLTLTAQSETVSVTGAAEQVITTEVSNLAETKTGRELVDLPVALASRASGSTSPLTTLTTQTGVQTDASGNISIAGSKPSMISYSLDGISNANTRGVNGAAPILTELFPSFSSIAEIRISEVNNSAEFSGISDVTTVSKGGGNVVHGGLFENLQNSSMNARSTFAATVPKLILNDFGGNLAGPVVLPKLYSGRNKTFFFATYEGLRLPKQTLLTESVPSVALRGGDLSFYLPKVIKDPSNGAPYPNNQIPPTQISAVSQKALQYLYPLPNAVGPNAITNNFSYNYPAPTTSNQGDLRLDQNLGSRQTLFARFSYKRRVSISAPSGGSYFLGQTTSPANDSNFIVAYNFIISPTMVNEFRYGYSTEHGSGQGSYLSQDDAANLFGLPVPRPLAIGGGAPNFQITGFQSTGGGTSSWNRSSTQQIIDNLTLTKGKHTVKFGGDFRAPSAFYNNVWNGFRLGVYKFSGSVTNSVIGNPFAAFLLGYPDQTNLVSVTVPDMEASARHYGVYTQDDWKINSRFTLNYGLRYEYHPSFGDALGNLTGFLPDYYSTYNGQTIHGALVVPDVGLKNVDPNFRISIFPMPILTATQAGIPQNMRFSQKTDFAPRIGFAWRPFADNKTVVRGGYGKYIQTLLGGIASLGWGLATANNGLYTNSIANGKPTLQFPAPWPAQLAQPGTQNLADVTDIHLKDPYVQQWNFTLERDLGFNTGVRLSYDGSHGSELQVLHDINALPANTLGYAALASKVPYPQTGYSPIMTNGGISNYHAATVAVTKRMSHGLQLNASYVFSRNLSNEGGQAPSSFAGEYGGTITTPFNPGYSLDYGNVAYTRRNRFLATFVYDLPLGKGKALLTNANGVVDRIVGGWELAGVLLFQGGPFLTATAPGADPSGTGFANNASTGGRADIVAGMPLYPDNQSINNWINKAALAVPPNNIGRWPTSSVGMFNGPGTQAVSLSMFKAVPFTERVRMQVGVSASNLFNHPNYSPPNTSFGTASFGTISSLQSAEGAGPRSLQIGARLTF